MSTAHGQPPPDAAEAPRGRPHLSAYDQQLATQATTRLRQVQGAVTTDLDTLAMLLDGVITDFGRIVFRCPICQAGENDLILRGAAAMACSDLVWSCGLCRHRGTIWQLRRLVLESPFLVERLLDNLGVEVARG